MPKTTKGPNLDTPAMRQFFRLRDEVPGCLMFFRMGDFYELFLEDAEIAHRILGITLTQRSEGIPMAGMPHHAADGYLRRLVQAGYRVAVCDQVEDPKAAKGIVERAVVRVVTPGTLTDESLLEESRENPLAAVLTSETHATLAWCELSTGAYQFMRCAPEHLADELARLQPCELLFAGDHQADAPDTIKDIAPHIGCSTLPRAGWQFAQEEASRLLKKHYQIKDLSAFGLETTEDIGACGALLAYLYETQRTDGFAHLTRPRQHTPEAFLALDAATLASLEIVQSLRAQNDEGTLSSVFKHKAAPVTPMGKRRIREWLCFPLRDKQRIEMRQKLVSSFVVDQRLREELRDTLRPIQDIPRMVARLSLGRLSPRDLVAIGASSQACAPLIELLGNTHSAQHLGDTISQISDVLQALGHALSEACVDTPPAHMRDGGLIRDGYDNALDEARNLKDNAHQWLASYQAKVCEEIGLNQLKVGYNKVFGYYIELSQSNRDKAPEHWHRKQTLKNAERYISEELKEFETKVLQAGNIALEREHELFATLCSQAQACIPALQAYADVLATLDSLLAFAQRAVLSNWTQPTMSDDPILELKQARHPVLDVYMQDPFVPNDTDLTQPTRLALITGPNMAGKSTYIRQAALCVILAHAGSFVPAESATIGLTDRVMARVGAHDELSRGRSTFMVEMAETAHICHHATAQSLIVLDEIGRGTSTLDGLSLAWSIAEHLSDLECRCLFATHYHEITQLAEVRDNVQNLSVLAREWKDDIVFLHQIEKGAANRSYGIHVARIAGIPPRVIQRASELMGQLEVKHNTLGAGQTLQQTARQQLPLFHTTPEPAQPHPVIEKLRDVDIMNLSPMQAFDILHKLTSQLDADKS